MAWALVLLSAATAGGCTRADPSAERPRAAEAPPLIPFNSNFWSYWTHYWATWLPDHPVYEMIEVTAYEDPKDPWRPLVRVFLTERAGRKRQYFYLNDEAETRRSRANSYFRDIEFRRSGGEGPQSLVVAFTDKDGVPVRWTIRFAPEARLRSHGAGLTPSIHSLGGVLLFALRTRTVDTHDDSVTFGGVEYASPRPAEDRTPGTRSWYNPDYYSAVLVHGRAVFGWSGGILTNTSWGRTFTPAGPRGRRYRSQPLGPENYIEFETDRDGGLHRYAHFSRGHALAFAFRPAIPAAPRLRGSEVVRFTASFDDRPALMTGEIRIGRPEPGLVTLDWIPTGPPWAVGRDFRSELRLRDSGYELSTAERPASPAD